MNQQISEYLYVKTISRINELLTISKINELLAIFINVINGEIYELLNSFLYYIINNISEYLYVKTISRIYEFKNQFEIMIY